MRPTLAPDMLKTLSFNMNHGTAEARLYEIATVYDKHALTERRTCPRKRRRSAWARTAGAWISTPCAARRKRCFKSQGIDDYTVEPAPNPIFTPAAAPC